MRSPRACARRSRASARGSSRSATSSCMLHQGSGELQTVTGVELAALAPRRPRGAVPSERRARRRRGDAAALPRAGGERARVRRARRASSTLLDELAAAGRASAALDPLVLSFQLKLLWLSGYLPHVTSCAECGAETGLAGYSPRAGGAVCRQLRERRATALADEGLLGIEGLLRRPLAEAREAGPRPRVARGGARRDHRLVRVPRRLPPPDARFRSAHERRAGPVRGPLLDSGVSTERTHQQDGERRPASSLGLGALAVPNYQDMIARSRRTGPTTAACSCSRTTPSSAPARSTRRRSCAASGRSPWKTAYVEPVIRPTDGRYGENPFRFQHYFQYQVDPQAGAGGRARPLLRLARGDRHRPAAARRAPRRGRLGAADARRLGPRLGGLVRRHGDHAVHVLPAARRHRARARSRPRSRTALERLAMFLQGKRSAFELEWAPGVTWGDVYRENERQWSIYNFEEAPVDVLTRRFAEHEDECRAPARARPAAAGLRPGAEVLAHLQPARRARRDLGDRARGLHRPRAQPRARGRAGVPRRWRLDADAAA